MKKIILLILFLASASMLWAYRLPTAWSVGGGLSYDSVRVTAYRAETSSATLTNEVDTSFVGAGTSGSFALFVDSLVAYTVRYMYFCNPDTFREWSYGNLPVDYGKYVKRGVENTQAVRDSMDEASQVGAGGSSGCPDSVGNAWTIVAWDSVNSAAVTSATITLKPTLTSSTILAQVNGSPFTFTAANGTYYVVTEANTVTFPVRSFTISGARTDTINGGGLTITATSNPGMATIFGVIDRNGSPAVGVWVDLVLTRPDTLTIDTSFIELRTRVVTNASGVWQADVYYLSGSTRNFYYSYKDAYGRALYFRPIAAGSYNVREILVDKP